MRLSISSKAGTVTRVRCSDISTRLRMIGKMRFHGRIKVCRYEVSWNPETIEIYADRFEAKSIQSAKSKLTKIANETELFSWIQPWDNEKRTYTGKDLRWRPWDSLPITYKQDNGVEVAYSTRMTERVFGETIYPETHGKYGKSVEYRVDLTVYWKLKQGESE